jgi:GrpB-like predicted nucleotidyltransferase (UPF0157 family)
MEKRLLLIGEQRIRPRADDYGFIAAAFNRLPREAALQGGYARFVGYESLVKGEPLMRFFGIEVGENESIPEGMAAWDLDDAEWTMWRQKGGKKTRAWQEEIHWLWFGRTRTYSGSHSGFTSFDESASFGGDSPFPCHLGEFTAKGPEDWGAGGRSAEGEFLLFAHLYYDLRKDGFEDEIHLLEYDPSWPGQFEEMAERLRHRLGPDLVLRIEHYGSTAVPGMPAKPVIDILVEVPSFMEAKRRALPRLDDVTWEYWWYDDHMVFFKRKSPMGERTHHVHMAPQGHKVWGGLAFRDYLRTHPEAAARYAALKQRLAAKWRQDRERYTAGKAVFVRDLTAKAQKAL